ncbi:Uncharacterised protein [Citrobacter koseri]|uniref:Uncharacterized protein n=1 Tax=Citrobacter koseri TaxID=545 RepID=A0A2X2VF18_CITKO|nr:Uncharacterised protein [Citrobacter koseri]
MSSEYKRLPHLYNQLWAIFTGVKNKNDTEQLRAVLVPKMEERDGEMVDIHQKTRDDFFEAVNGLCRMPESGTAVRYLLHRQELYGTRPKSL